MRLIRTLVLGAAGIAAYKYWKQRQSNTETAAPASYPQGELDSPVEKATASFESDTKESGKDYNAT